MSWKNPYKQVLNLVCKMSPNGQTCENYLRKEHPECFPAPSILNVIRNLPLRALKFLFSNHQLHCEQQSNACPYKRAQSQCPHQSGCCSLNIHDQDYAVLGGFFKSLIILAISIGILYAIFKAVAQRRGSTQ